jgi:hypothetical protein
MKIKNRCEVIKYGVHIIPRTAGVDPSGTRPVVEVNLNTPKDFESIPKARNIKNNYVGNIKGVNFEVL